MRVSPGSKNLRRAQLWPFMCQRLVDVKGRETGGLKKEEEEEEIGRKRLAAL